ncbi:MAG: alpha-L-fucosidase, partial [Clostridia bacterium]|nr:alpha-L-fucosidase [Clostridia bacterium]
MKHENKFGMFIHWGVYALVGYHEQALARLGMDRGEYEKLIYSFNPTEYDPEEWVLLAKNAGMK